MTNNAKTVESDTIESLYKTNFMTEIDFATNHLYNAKMWLKKMGKVEEYARLEKLTTEAIAIGVFVGNGWDMKNKEVKE